jgi:hypothetical protein
MLIQGRCQSFLAVCSKQGERVKGWRVQLPLLSPFFCELRFATAVIFSSNICTAFKRRFVRTDVTSVHRSHLLQHQFSPTKTLFSLFTFTFFFFTHNILSSQHKHLSCQKETKSINHRSHPSKPWKKRKHKD